MQSKKNSFIESLTNTAVGFLTTMAFSPLFYWMCDVKVHYGQMTALTFLFTILSIARGYIVRRFFNKRENGSN